MTPEENLLALYEQAIFEGKNEFVYKEQEQEQKLDNPEIKMNDPKWIDKVAHSYYVEADGRVSKQVRCDSDGLWLAHDDFRTARFVSREAAIEWLNQK
jgi:hypothetical protein